MIFTATRNKPFKEEFSFKNAAGRPTNIPSGRYSVILEHDGFVREFKDLRIGRNTIYWTMTSDTVNELAFDTMYFTLNYNNQTIARGVLRIKEE